MASFYFRLKVWYSIYEYFFLCVYTFMLLTLWLDLTIVTWHSLQLSHGEFFCLFCSTSVSYVTLADSVFKSSISITDFLSNLSIVERRMLKCLTVIQDSCIFLWIFKFSTASKLWDWDRNMYVYFSLRLIDPLRKMKIVSKHESSGLLS